MSFESSQNRVDRLAGNFLSLLGGLALRGLLSVLVSVVVARYLGPDEMGRYAFLVWLIGLLAVTLSLGIPTTVTRYTAEAVGAERPWVAGALLRDFVGRQLAWTLAVGAALSLGGLLRGVSEAWGVLLLLAAANIPSLVLHGTLAAFLSGFQAFRIQAALGVCHFLLQAMLVVAVAFLDAGLSGLILAHAITNAVGVAAAGFIAWRIGRRYGVFPIGAAPLADIRQEASRYARSLILLAVLDTVVWQRSEVFFLQTLSAPAEVAFYTLAFGLAWQVGRIPYQASVVLFPLFPASVGAGRPDDLAALHQTAMRYLVLVGAPLYVGLATIAPELVHVFYGDDYRPAAQVLRILAAGGLLSSFAGASPPVLHALMAQRRLVRQGLSTAGVNVALALLLVPAGGAYGAAVANVAAQGMASLLVVLAATQATGRPVALGPLGRILGAAIAIAAPVRLTLTWSSGLGGLAFAVLVGIVTYPLVLRLTRALSAEDAERLWPLCRHGPRWAQSTSARLVGFLCRP